MRGERVGMFLLGGSQVEQLRPSVPKVLEFHEHDGQFALLGHASGCEANFSIALITSAGVAVRS